MSWKQDVVEKAIQHYPPAIVLSLRDLLYTGSERINADSIMLVGDFSDTEFSNSLFEYMRNSHPTYKSFVGDYPTVSRAPRVTSIQATVSPPLRETSPIDLSHRHSKLVITVPGILIETTLCCDFIALPIRRLL